MKHPSAEVRFLAAVSKAISRNELARVAEEAGFLPPVSFEFEKLRAIANTRAFPRNEHIQYSWALYESELSRLKLFSDPIRMFLSGVFVYCNFHEPLGPRVESDFYWLGVESALQYRDPKIGAAFCEFLESLGGYEKAANKYQKYFCSISICFLRAYAFPTDGFNFEAKTLELQTFVSDKTESDVTDSLSGLSPWRSVSPDCVGGQGNLDRLTLCLPHNSALY
jgi:hypothetical protein